MHTETMQIISEYRVMFLAGFLFFLFVMFLIVLSQMIQRIKEYKEDKENELTREDAMKLDFEKIAAERRNGIIRKIIAPDGINPGPDDHLLVYDGVKKLYSRTLTISEMAQRVNFANTFAPLFNFPDCTSTVFIEPIDASTMSHKLDKHIIIIESEFYTANDANRKRKLQEIYAEINDWAREVETGRNKFLRVGFVFTIYADSLEKLTRASDTFRNIARSKSLDVSVCVCCQSEAYIANAPMNRYVNESSQYANDGICYHYMDMYSAAVVYNYTSVTFSHKEGIPLGRDRQLWKPVIYNPYNVTYNGFTHCVVGKTGTGKSATMKMLTYRCSILGYRFASLDVQPRMGTGDGEYAGICDILGGLNFELKSDSNNCLNIFEVMETERFEKSAVAGSAGLVQGRVARELDLRAAIAQHSNLIKIMISENGDADSLKDRTFMDKIINEAIERIFANHGIIDGDPDTLYENPNGEFKHEKPLPTIGEFYRELLLIQKADDDVDNKTIRKIVITAMEKYVKDCCYSEDSITFFDETEYGDLETDKNGRKIYHNPETGRTEFVRRIHGVRSYFDGQSTLRYSTQIPWVNIDCSQLDETSKQVAMSVGMNYINERIIKGNSESRDSNSSKVCCIFDEAHMVFKIEPARVLLDQIVRTARKRSVSLFICTQTLREFGEFPETEGIRKNAAALFVFKQDYSDKQYLIDTLGLTEAQVNSILQQGGDIDRIASADDEGELAKEAAKHRGEMTIVINRTAIPIKVDYRPRTEKGAVETASSEIMDKSVKKAAG